MCKHIATNFTYIDHKEAFNERNTCAAEDLSAIRTEQIITIQVVKHHAS